MTDGPGTGRTSVLARLKQDLFPDGCFVIKGPFAAELRFPAYQFAIFNMGCAKHKYLGACGFAEGAISVVHSLQCPAHRSARRHGPIIPPDDMVHLEFGLRKTGPQPHPEVIDIIM